MARRRGGGVKERARKKVTVKLIERLHAGKVTGPYRIMEDLIDKHHKHLKEAKIAIAWRYGWKATVDGHTKLGQAKKGSDLDRELHNHDFVILLNFERWNNGNFSEAQMRALVDHELCFPAGTQFTGPKPECAITRRYTGKLVEITTASGDFLSGTPNHPVLTSAGWVPLGMLHEGLDVVRCGLPERVARGVDPDEYQIPARIEDVASSGLVDLRFVPQATHDFDADVFNDEIDVVGPDGELSFALDAISQQHFAHGNLDRRDRIPVLVTSGSHLGERFGLVPLTSPSGVSFGDVDLTVANDDSSVALAGTSVPGRYAAFEQHPFQELSRHASLLFDRISGGPGNVSCDRIVSVRFREFDGHVFNVQTRGNWYIANGIVTHNCHCEVSKDANGEPKTDEQGRTVWRIRAHDIEEFQEVVSRHGQWKGDIEKFADAIAAKTSRPLLDGLDKDGKPKNDESKQKKPAKAKAK